MEAGSVDRIKQSNKFVTYAYRATSGASATVWSGESLVQIQVHYVKAHIARSYHSEKRIHVGSVVVEQTSALMDKGSNLLYIPLEKSEGVGIGHHDSGYVISKQRLEIFDIHQTVSLGFYHHHL